MYLSLKEKNWKYTEKGRRLFNKSKLASHHLLFFLFKEKIRDLLLAVIRHSLLLAAALIKFAGGMWPLLHILESDPDKS